MKPLILEDVEGKNINRAEKFIKTNYPELISQGRTARDLVTQVRNDVPSSRLPKLPNGKDSCRFLPGVARIYFGFLKDSQPNELQRKVAKLEQIMKILTTSHADEYDGNLNGLGYDDLDSKFSGVIQKNLDDEIQSLKDRKFERDTSYTIVPIPDFETATEYADYVDWCVTQDENAYDSYTKDGLGIFYFCLKKGFEHTKQVPDENCPMDEYGKSMIAISVNEDGSLNTATCRWNHNEGGDDHIFESAKEVSEFFGVNFFETFKPKSIDQILEKFRKDSVESKLADRLGGIETKDGKLVLVKDGRLKIYCRVYADEAVKCFAYDRFCWFDLDGNEVEPPASIGGNFDCSNCGSLTSLEGAPEKVGGNFDCSNCTSLTSLEGAPREVGRSFFCNGCTSLTSLEGAPREVGRSFFCNGCERLTSLEGAPREVGEYFFCSNCGSLTSLEGAPREVSGNFSCNGCTSLTSLEGAPRKVGEYFFCSNCGSLTSLEGAPEKIGGNFDCSNCTSLTSLEGAPREVGRSFFCNGCTSLTSLEGAPRKIGKKFSCSGCSHINADQTKKYLEWLKTNQIKKYLEWLKIKPRTNYHADVMSESCEMFVNAVVNDDNEYARTLLEDIVRGKIQKRLSRLLRRRS